MLSEPATVIAREGHHLCLRTSRQATCSGCSVRSGCGQYLLMPQDERLELSDCDPAMLAALGNAGQVQVELAGDRLLLLAALFYVLPLLLLLLTTLLAVWSGLGEGGTMLAAAAGLAGGIVIARALLRNAAVRARVAPRVHPLAAAAAASEMSRSPS